MINSLTAFLFQLRNRHFLVIDIMLLLITPSLALALRTDGLERYSTSTLVITLTFLVLKLVIFYAAGLYRRFWRYASIDELTQIAAAIMLVLVIQTLTFFAILRPLGWVTPDFPRSIPLIEGLLALIAVGGLRFSVRVAERLNQRLYGHGDAERVLVVGAGEAGVGIVREMQGKPRLKLHPVGFVDDDPGKLHIRIRGISVLGNRDDIPALVRETGTTRVIIAMPTAPGKIIREIVQICERAQVKTNIVPGISELLDGTVSANQLRNVEIEDLLRREPVMIAPETTARLLRGKRVLITGGGGSIGSQLCRQVLQSGPAELVVVGHGENSVFEIVAELRRYLASSRGVAGEHEGFGTTKIHAVIADIRFAERIMTVLGEHQPHIVFHAAAHKHVPLMEENPAEAITNNVLGTRNLLDAAVAAGVERFVMISTDKAVNPTSIMGASKRAAELLVHQAAVRTGKPYVAVRFGNVLGSRGSVVLTFKQQIMAGGPVTVTHPEMCRFFMTIPEAVTLVLQAAVLGQGGEVFVLDMGEPIKIGDLARDMIELSGLEVGRDIDIEYTGLRPGEKLYEELFVPGEDYARTEHEKVFIACNASRFVPSYLQQMVDQLGERAMRNDRAAIVAGLQALIPEFRPLGSAVAVGEARPLPAVGGLQIAVNSN